jgi:hypothetical protein
VRSNDVLFIEQPSVIAIIYMRVVFQAMLKRLQRCDTPSTIVLYNLVNDLHHWVFRNNSDDIKAYLINELCIIFDELQII